VANVQKKGKDSCVTVCKFDWHGQTKTIGYQEVQEPMVFKIVHHLPCKCCHDTELWMTGDILQDLILVLD
jgi:hypothetical protein